MWIRRFVCSFPPPACTIPPIRSISPLWSDEPALLLDLFCSASCGSKQVTCPYGLTYDGFVHSSVHSSILRYPQDS
jgi:hypothetical protein